jgi:hypothetical protein
MYWGYGKARYRQVKKTSFDYAKKEVEKALADACTLDLYGGSVIELLDLWMPTVKDNGPVCRNVIAYRTN